ncbi:hypothetical protein EV1_032027 [Malus domestica]
MDMPVNLNLETPPSTPKQLQTRKTGTASGNKLDCCKNSGRAVHILIRDVGILEKRGLVVVPSGLPGSHE